MSQYVLWDGVVRYPTESQFETALTLLDRHGYLDDTRQYILTGEDPSGVVMKPYLVFPCNTYRSIHYLTEQLLCGTESWLLWCITDGDFLGGFMVNGAELEGRDLFEYTQELVPLNVATLPDFAEYDFYEYQWNRQRLYDLLNLESNAAFPEREQLEPLYDRDTNLYFEVCTLWTDAIMHHFRCRLLQKYASIIQPTLAIYDRGKNLLLGCSQANSTSQEREETGHDTDH